jgi:hypothetical protein
MPRRIDITREYASSGIDITWTPSAQRLDIGGWYHGCVGIEGDSFTLREFFDRLGISQKDCQKAFQSTPSRGKDLSHD